MQQRIDLQLRKMGKVSRKKKIEQNYAAQFLKYYCIYLRISFPMPNIEAFTYVQKKLKQPLKP